MAQLQDSWVFYSQVPYMYVNPILKRKWNCAIYILNASYSVFFLRPVLPCTKDVGFNIVARTRGWHICVHRAWGRFVKDPAQVYKELCEAYTNKLEVSDIDAAFWVEDAKEFEADMKRVKKSKKKDELYLGLINYSNTVI